MTSVFVPIHIKYCLDNSTDNMGIIILNFMALSGITMITASVTD